MADRENVIKALELCACDGEMHCKECPYDFEPSIKCVMLMHTDALTLLEAQKYHTVTIGFNPDVDEYVKKVANLALDEFVYQGKTIREWVETLKAQEPVEARLNLCDSCKQDFGGCSARGDDITFGCGIGNDNVIGCREYVNRWKAQEPVEPKAMQEGWYCSNCGGTVGFFDYSGDKVCGEITYNYCPDCGRKVKWDD